MAAAASGMKLNPYARGTFYSGRSFEERTCVMLDLVMIALLIAASFATVGFVHCCRSI
jgi:hypothetical protein